MAGWLVLNFTGIYPAKNYEIGEETLRISGTVSTTKQHNYEYKTFVKRLIES